MNVRVSENLLFAAYEVGIREAMSNSPLVAAYGVGICKATSNNLLITKKLAPVRSHSLENLPRYSVNSNTTTPERSASGSTDTVHLPWKLVVDFPPQFDGNPCSLIKPVQQYQLANDRISSASPANLLGPLRNKMKGPELVDRRWRATELCL